MSTDPSAKHILDAGSLGLVRRARVQVSMVLCQIEVGTTFSYLELYLGESLIGHFNRFHRYSGIPLCF